MCVPDNITSEEILGFQRAILANPTTIFASANLKLMLNKYIVGYCIYVYLRLIYCLGNFAQSGRIFP